MEQIASYQKNENTFRPSFINYASILDVHDVNYREGDVWLNGGPLKEPEGYIFFLPVRICQIPKLLSLLLPALGSMERASLLIGKNEVEISKLHNGYYGPHMEGKGIQIWPSSAEVAIDLAKELIKLTEDFHGVLLTDCVRLGNVLYVSHIRATSAQHPIKMMKQRLFKPFQPSRKRNTLPTKRIIGKWFVPVQVIQSSGKGAVYKGVDLIKMKWCLIKQANAHAADDVHNRDITDRLLWQRVVTETLRDTVPVPKIIGYAEYESFSFLITEYIEGESLKDRVKNLLHSEGWLKTEKRERIQLMRYYLEVLEIIEKIHVKGFLHRDISPANFLVGENGKLAVIDFELAWSFRDGLPDPPFVTGTLGYISPEQAASKWPEIFQEIYSLGALFYYFVTGEHPGTLGKDKLPEKVAKKFEQHQINDLLCNRMLRCFSPKSEERPSLGELKMVVIHELHEMIFKT